jgi:fermentation-respiration switch protein FrsA (DUF1100 family)
MLHLLKRLLLLTGAVLLLAAAAGASAQNFTRQDVRSLELALEYIPSAGIHFISPTPLMMIVAQNDTLTPTDLAIEAFGRAREPKQLVILPGGHFDAYVSGFEQSSTPALNWFKQHLMK